MVYRSTIDIPNIVIAIPIVKRRHNLSGEIDLRKEMGAKIRAIRNAKGISGRELSNMSGVSQAFISEVERGLVAISSEKLVLIARELGVGVETLVSQVKEDQGSSQTSPPPNPNSGVRIPSGLTEIANEYGLSFKVTMKLLESAQLLMAHRSIDGSPIERTTEDWRRFYLKVKDYLDEV